MPRQKRETRNGQLYCPSCEKWLHPSRFTAFRKRESHSGSLVTFHPRCRACEQTERNDRKNEDRAEHIVRSRATTYAQAAKVPVEFFMEDLNWRSLVPMVRAWLTYPDECACPNCGHTYIDQADFQLDHRAPPRDPVDWARLHARNVGPLDCACNASKNDRPYEQWLDEQEDARLSVAAYYGRGSAEPVHPGSPSLFDTPGDPRLFDL